MTSGPRHLRRGAAKCTLLHNNRANLELDTETSITFSVAAILWRGLRKAIYFVPTNLTTSESSSAVLKAPPDTAASPAAASAAVLKAPPDTAASPASAASPVSADEVHVTVTQMSEVL